MGKRSRAHRRAENVLVGSVNRAPERFLVCWIVFRRCSVRRHTKVQIVFLEVDEQAVLAWRDGLALMISGTCFSTVSRHWPRRRSGCRRARAFRNWRQSPQIASGLNGRRR